MTGDYERSEDALPGHKRRQLLLIALASLGAKTLWFSASAVVPQLTEAWRLDGGAQAWLTLSVQLGFVVGAFISASLNLPDRYDPHHVFAFSCALAAMANLALPLLEPPLSVVLWLRGLTGAALAGVYPTGMKLVTTWYERDRGFGVGVLIAALTAGAAAPHLINAVPLGGAGGMPAWQSVLKLTSLLGFVAAAIALGPIRCGPYSASRAPFDWRYLVRIFRDRPLRLVNFGYLGHMWELYAMWPWAPLFLLASYQAAGFSPVAGRLAGFATVAIGSIGCVVAGRLGDRYGRSRVTALCLAISGSCCLIVGFFFATPLVLTAVALCWGLTVVADSGQFSAAASELADPRYVGTVLTVQTGVGFLLTMVSIRLVPSLVDLLGWRYVFMVLAIGPLIGIVSMLRLRRLPAAVKMAGGNR